jgi:hypothetical protein
VSIQSPDPNHNGERMKNKNIFQFGKKNQTERRKGKKKTKIFEKKRVDSKEKREILKKKKRKRLV